MLKSRHGDANLMAGADRRVIRMFASDPRTIRWETRIVEGHGLELKVLGPGALRRSYTFMDAAALVEHQVQLERLLLSNGYTVLPENERRTGYDRRRRPRGADDRRKQ